MVRLIFEMTAEGHTYMSIAQTLNSRGYPTPSNYKRQQGYKVDNMHEPIVDAELWERVQELRKNRRRARPFNTTFTRQMNTARRLYGKQLKMPQLTAEEIRSELEPLKFTPFKYMSSA